jgi:hypothetical protein
MNESEMLQLEDVRYAGLPEVNVGTGERWASVISGLLLMLFGISRKSVGGAALAAGGAYMLFRGATGHCYGYQMLGVNTSRYGDRMLPADEPPPPSVEESDEVVESSWESFPTSDPPSWTMGREREEQ